MSAEDRFRAAVNVIRNLPSKGSFQPSTDLQLKFYSYFKQATEGPCLVAKPSFWDVVGKAKWDAWKNLGNMPKEEAMENYVEELKQIIETMSYTESVSQFMDLLGPFYEVVPITKSNSQPTLNGDKDIEENGGGGVAGKVNGFGDQLESDGEEFSDTYDHVRESVSAALSRASVGQNGGGDNGYASENETNNNLVETTLDSRTVDPKLTRKDKNVKTLPDKKRRNSDEIINGDLTNLRRPNHDRSRLPDKDNDESNDTILQARGGAEQNVVVPRTSAGDIGTAAAAGGGIPPNRGARSRNPREGAQAPSGGNLSRLLGGAGGNGPPSGGGSASSQDVNAQLALVVIKLQNSLDEVNARLLALENALPNAKSRGASNVVEKVFGISPNLLVLILLWPFVATFLMKAAQRRNQSL